jgi:osmotically-inducible protein OsmY
MYSKTQRILRDVQEQLAWDVRVDDTQVQIHVREGRVTLTGRVPFYTTRVAAADDAWRIPGVTRVDNRIEVTSDGRRRERDDARIRHDLEGMLADNPLLESAEVSVRVDDGRVLLEGIVSSPWHRAVAEETAYITRGVMDVRNRLVVVPSSDTDDEAIARVIFDTLERNLVVRLEDIDVAVEDGVVTLVGAVPGYLTLREVRSIVSRTPGVVDVRDRLGIQRRL